MHAARVSVPLATRRVVFARLRQRSLKDGTPGCQLTLRLLRPLCAACRASVSGASPAVFPAESGLRCPATPQWRVLRSCCSAYARAPSSRRHPDVTGPTRRPVANARDMSAGGAQKAEGAEGTRGFAARAHTAQTDPAALRVLVLYSRVAPRFAHSLDRGVIARRGGVLWSPDCALGGCRWDPSSVIRRVRKESGTPPR